MPLMPRPDKKATKVAYALLGTPANLVKHKMSKHDQEVEMRLQSQETRLMR